MHPVSVWYEFGSCGEGKTFIFRVGGMITVEIKSPSITPAMTHVSSIIIS